MSLKLKIRLPDGEIRRTALSSPDYAELASKVTSFLGPLYDAQKELKVTYLDDEGDHVAISSDLELKEAFGAHVDTLTISVSFKEKLPAPVTSNPVPSPAPTPAPAPSPSPASASASASSKSYASTSAPAPASAPAQESLYPEVPVFDTAYSVPPPSSSRDFNDGFLHFTNAFASYLQEPYEQEFQAYQQTQPQPQPQPQPQQQPEEAPRRSQPPQPPQPPHRHQHQHQHFQQQHPYEFPLHPHSHPHPHPPQFRPPQFFAETPLGMHLFAFWAMFMSSWQQFGVTFALQRAWLAFYYSMGFAQRSFSPRFHQWRREGFGFRKMLKLVVVIYIFTFLMIPVLFFALSCLVSLAGFVCKLFWYGFLIRLVFLAIRKVSRAMRYGCGGCRGY